MTVFFVALEIVIIEQVLGALAMWTGASQVIAAGMVSAANLAIGRFLRVSPDLGLSLLEERLTIPRWVRFLAIALPTTVVVAALFMAVFWPDSGGDSLGYHRSIVVGWFQQGSLWRIGALENGMTYEGAYPANGDITSMWLLVPFGRDYLVQLTPFLWLAGVTLVIMSILRDFGLRMWAAATVTTTFLLLPFVLLGQLATLHVDLLPLLGVGVMFWAGLRWIRFKNSLDYPLRWIVVAGLGMGLAAGAKPSELPTLIAFAVGLMIIAARRRRWFDCVAFGLAAVGPVIIWPIRNLAMRGSPFWPMGFGPFKSAQGGMAFEHPAVNNSPLKFILEDRLGLIMVVLATVAYGAFVFLVVPGLRYIWQWSRDHRLAWVFIVVPILGYIGYLLTPMAGHNGAMVFVSQRYYMPVVLFLTLGLGLALFGKTKEADASIPGQRWMAILGVAMIVNIVILAAFMYPHPEFRWPLRAWFLGGTCGVTVAWLATKSPRLDVRRLLRPRVAVPCGAVLSIVMIAVAVFNHEARWYPEPPAQLYAQAIYHYLDANVSGSNIAYVAVESAPLFGQDLTNNAYYLGEPEVNYQIRPWRVKAEWEAALLATCTDYFVVSGRELAWGRSIPERLWAQTSDILQPVVEAPPGTEDASLYRVNGKRPDVCRSPEPTKDATFADLTG